MDMVKLIAKNSVMGIANQGVAILIQLISRMLLLKYVGVELLGINSALTSVLSTLSLAELGFQSAIVFHLYKPLNRNEEVQINQIMNVLRVVYSGIGIIILAGAIVIIPFLHIVLKGIEVNGYVVTMFLIMAINVSTSYFVAYKRTLLYADQKEYIIKMIDTVTNIFFSLLSFFIIILSHNYLLFLIFHIIQTVISNYIIHKKCTMIYPYLCKRKFEKKIFLKIWGSAKDILGSKIAGYIYGATDNLIISTFIGTIVVGYISNYTMITTAIKRSVSVIFYAMTPIIGNGLTQNISGLDNGKKFMAYTHLRYVIASLIVIPWVLFADDFISIFFGKQYVMSKITVVLLGIDIYIHIVYSVCCEFISAAGCFKMDKYIAILGAFINIGISIFLGIKIGVEGVLIGTVISQIFFWIARACLIYKVILVNSMNQFTGYFLKNLIWSMITFLLLYILHYVKKSLNYSSNLQTVLTEIIFSEFIYFALYFLLFSKTSEFKEVKKSMIFVFKRK